LLHTFMTILQEFGIFEEKIKSELNDQLPLLATSKILMECVKAGMGREAAHQLIKKHSTSTSAGEFFQALSRDKDFPISISQMRGLIEDPSNFAVGATEQSKKVVQKISKITSNKISNVELAKLR